MSAFEWGSGRSTTWFAQRLGHITSIENDAVWYEQVQETLKHVKISNVSLKLVPLEHAYADLYFPYYDPLPHYVEAISEVADESLDFVVVDGHYRQACTWLAMRKIKPGGYLLIDNTDWLPREQWPVPFAWPIVHQSRNVLTQTTLWQKPAQDSPVKV